MLREVVTTARQQHTILQYVVQQRDVEIGKLQLLIKRLLRHQCGRRSEQLSADQLQFAAAADLANPPGRGRAG